MSAQPTRGMLAGVIDQLKQAEFSLLRVEQLIDRGEFDRWDGCAIEAQEARAAVTRLIERLVTLKEVSA